MLRRNKSHFAKHACDQCSILVWFNNCVLTTGFHSCALLLHYGTTYSQHIFPCTQSFCRAFIAFVPTNQQTDMEAWE